MPLQNRVDPFSRIHAVPARGMFTGNRGILHDAETRTLKKQSWATDGWVICALEFKGWQAPIMGPGHWTELFFPDEAVALAAGHRPCHTCRRGAARAFLGAAGFSSAAALHAAINAEMKPLLRVRRQTPRQSCDPAGLPDGAFFAVGDSAYLKHRGAAHRFAWTGYGPAEPLPELALRLTPEISCAALANGYAPQLHPSLG